MRPAEMDRALCLHEAAHAVVGEVLRPGCVIAVEMDYVSGTPCASGWVFSAADAVTSWTWWDYSDPNALIAVAAGRYGEEIEPDPLADYHVGDDEVIREATRSPMKRRTARRRAKALVAKHELAIRRVAKALKERRYMTGDEIREVARL